MYSLDSLRSLAHRVGWKKDHAPASLESFEANLRPIIRCAIRSGRGHPDLVRWVQRNLVQVPGGADRARLDPDRAARPMARLLCQALLSLEGATRAPAYDTVLENVA
jgi:hypothetical protein